jgi:hypothetical protein
MPYPRPIYRSDKLELEIEVTDHPDVGGSLQHELEVQYQGSDTSTASALAGFLRFRPTLRILQTSISTSDT